MVYLESRCIYGAPANGGGEQRPLGNMLCKQMAFKGLQVEAQAWGVWGAVVEVRLRCVPGSRG